MENEPKPANSPMRVKAIHQKDKSSLRHRILGSTLICSIAVGFYFKSTDLSLQRPAIIQPDSQPEIQQDSQPVSQTDSRNEFQSDRPTMDIPEAKPNGPASKKAYQKSQLDRRSQLYSEVPTVPTVDLLGKTMLSVADQNIASDEAEYTTRKYPSIAELLGLSARQYREITRKEAILKRKLQIADSRGANGNRRLLLSEHRAWLREYLGQGRYEQYQELARAPSNN